MKLNMPSLTKTMLVGYGPSTIFVSIAGKTPMPLIVSSDELVAVAELVLKELGPPQEWVMEWIRHRARMGQVHNA